MGGGESEERAGRTARVDGARTRRRSSKLSVEETMPAKGGPLDVVVLLLVVLVVMDVVVEVGVRIGRRGEESGHVMPRLGKT